jgi:hypothetical protein
MTLKIKLGAATAVAALSVYSVAHAVVFDGAYVSGTSGTGGVTFEMFNGATLVATSTTLDQTSTPTFLASGYAGQVTSVEVLAANGFYVLDNITYDSTVVTFDGLPDGLVPNGYGGINWANNWNVYSEAQNPYNPESPPARIYTNYALWPATQFDAVPFYFGGGVPEPATWLLTLVGFGALGSALRIRRRADQATA